MKEIDQQGLDEKRTRAEENAASVPLSLGHGSSLSSRWHSRGLMNRTWSLTRRTNLLAVLVLLLAAALFSTSSTQATSEFVRIDGTAFTLNGASFYYAGANTYYLIYKSNFMVNDVLDSAQAMGMKVIRTWGFIDRGSLDERVPSIDPPGHKDGVYFQYWDPVAGTPAYNDGPTGLEKLDYVIYAAGRRGIKLIIPLVNNWRQFGGIDQYVTWYGLTYHDEFYTDPRTRQAYRSWVLHLLNRTNIYTGVQYKNDPTIMAWELANEPRCKGSGARPRSPNCNSTTLLNWVQEMSGFIKQNDPNHLVSVGDEGFFNQTGTWDWVYNGSEGIDFAALIQLPTVDFGTFHLYPTHWGKTDSWGTQWIQEHLAVGAHVGKPVILEEFGWSDRATRDSVYQTWLDAVYRGQGAGDNVWMFAGHQDDDTLFPDDGLTVYYPSSVASTISAHAAQMAVTCGQCLTPTATNSPTAVATPTSTPAPAPTEAPVSLVDELNDFSQIVARSTSLGFDDTNVGFFHGDPFRLTRKTRTVEWAVWHLNDLRQFAVVTYHWPYEARGDFTFYVSSDNVTFTPITPSIQDLGGDWIQVEYRLSPPPGTNYVKVEFPNSSAYRWNPQIGSVRYSNATAVSEPTATATVAPTNTPAATPTSTAAPPPSLHVEAALKLSGQKTQTKVRLYNDSLQAQTDLRVRVFVNLSELYAAGFTATDVVTEKLGDECGRVSIGPPSNWKAAQFIYYVDLDWGASMFPPNSSCEVRFRIRPVASESVWDATNDDSYQGLDGSFRKTERMPVYQQDLRVYGVEP